jgi:hypothetical protein
MISELTNVTAIGNFHSETNIETMQNYVSRLAQKLYFKSYLRDNLQVR